MSKSLGNVHLVHDLLDQRPGEVLRWACWSATIAQPLDWTGEPDRAVARRRSDRLYGALRRVQRASRPRTSRRRAALMAALEDDLNTPGGRPSPSCSPWPPAAETAARQSRRTARPRASCWPPASLLGFLQGDPEAWFQGGVDRGAEARRSTSLIAAAGRGAGRQGLGRGRPHPRRAHGVECRGDGRSHRGDLADEGERVDGPTAQRPFTGRAGLQVQEAAAGRAEAACASSIASGCRRPPRRSGRSSTTWSAGRSGTRSIRRLEGADPHRHDSWSSTWRCRASSRRSDHPAGRSWTGCPNEQLHWRLKMLRRPGRHHPLPGDRSSWRSASTASSPTASCSGGCCGRIGQPRRTRRKICQRLPGGWTRR